MANLTHKDFEFLNLPEHPLARAFRIFVTEEGLVGVAQTEFSQIFDEDPNISGTVTLCLVVEGDRSLRLGSNLGRYFRDHPELEELVDAYLDKRRPSTACNDINTVTWWRPVSQAQDQYAIHEKIPAGVEEGAFDEEKAHWCQMRYSAWPSIPSGPYRLLTTPGPGKDKKYWHAAEERLFCYEAETPGKDGTVRRHCVLLVDPERYHLTSNTKLSLEHKNWAIEQQLALCFAQKQAMPTARINETTGEIKDLPFNRYAVKLRLALKRQPLRIGWTEKERQDLEWRIKQDVRMAIETVIRQEVSDLLQRMIKPLDTIELGLYDDVILRESAAGWRKQLGSWRNVLHHQSKGLAHGCSKLVDKGVMPEMVPPGTKRSTLTRTLIALVGETNRMRRRIEATLNALLLSSQIAEAGQTQEDAPAPPPPPGSVDSLLESESSGFPISWPNSAGQVTSVF